jgi:hypothetical protein
MKKENGTANVASSSTTSDNMTPSGFPAYKSQMFFGFVSMSILYCVTIACFDHLQEWLQLPPSDPQFCQPHDDHTTPCWRADLFAFEVVSGLALSWCGYKGFAAWHVKRIQNSIPTTPEGRLFGYIEEAHALTAVSTTFQLFDLAVSLLIPEQRQFLFLAHHVMAATVSWYGLNNQYFHYYGGECNRRGNQLHGVPSHILSLSLTHRSVFYLGCSEISTIPLIAIDLAKFFPPLPDTRYDFLVNAISGPLFAITFTYYRVILWWQVGFQMFRDIFHILKNGEAREQRPGRNHVLYVMMVLNFLLGLLQLYWFRTILMEAMKVLGLESSAEDKVEKEVQEL